MQGVPLPKVAAHVTGVGLFTEPPTADGEDNLMKSRNKISSPLCGVSDVSERCPGNDNRHDLQAGHDFIASLTTLWDQR